MASLNPIFTSEVSLRSLYLELTNESRTKREKQAWYIKTLGVVYLSRCLQVCELACMEFNSVNSCLSFRPADGLSSHIDVIQAMERCIEENKTLDG